VEIKYLKAGFKPGAAEVKRLKAAAEAQLKRYGGERKLEKSLEKTALIKIVLIFSGHEILYIGEL
jgi:hypothetical protein